MWSAAYSPFSAPGAGIGGLLLYAGTGPGNSGDHPDWAMPLTITIVVYGLAFVGMGVARLIGDRPAGVAFITGGIVVVGLGLGPGQVEILTIELIPLGVTLVCYGIAAASRAAWGAGPPAGRRETN